RKVTSHPAEAGHNRPTCDDHHSGQSYGDGSLATSAVREAVGGPPMFDIKRRGFITLIGGGGAWPLAARGQETRPGDRVGGVMAVAESDADVRSGVTIFQQSLQELGWTDGRNIRIDYRWGDADADRIHALAKELVGLQPDVLVAHSTPSAKGLLQATRSIPI